MGLNRNLGNIPEVIKESGGKIGIGTGAVAPVRELEVKGSVQLSNPTGSFILYGYGATNDWGLGTDTGQSTRDFNLYNYNTASINLHINRSTGFVGIGNTSPLAKLVVATASNVNFEVRNGIDYGLTGVGIDSRDNTRSARNAMFVYGSPIVLGGGSVGINTNNPQGTLHVETNGSSVRIGRTAGLASIKAISGYDGNMIVDGDGAGAVYLNHYNNGHVYIASGGGNVAVGKTTANAKFDVAGSIIGQGILIDNTAGNQQLSFRKNGSMRYAIGTEVGDGTTNDWSIYSYVFGGTSFLLYGNNNYKFYGTNVSDSRAKREINDLDFNFLDKVIALRPRSYYMNDDNGRLNYGFIAQEVHEVLPDLIGGDINGDDYIGLDYNGIIPVLVGAIKEQQETIKQLTNRIINLENK